MMTKKHFNELANALRETKANEQTVQAIAKVCGENNPKFDAYRFYQASYNDSTKVN